MRKFFYPAMAFIGLVAIALLAAVPAQAQLWRFDVSLDGSQEVGPVDTTGTGSAVAWLDEGAMTIDISGTFMDLVSPTRNNPAAAHLHGPAMPDQNAGIIVPLTADEGVTSGGFGGSGPLTAEQIAFVLAGNSYLNVHTEMHTGGEIRGQLVNPTFIPEPSAGVLLLIAMGVVALRTRQRAA